MFGYGTRRWSDKTLTQAQSPPPGGFEGQFQPIYCHKQEVKKSYLAMTVWWSSPTENVNMLGCLKAFRYPRNCQVTSICLDIPIPFEIEEASGKPSRMKAIMTAVSEILRGVNNCRLLFGNNIVDEEHRSSLPHGQNSKQ